MVCCRDVDASVIAAFLKIHRKNLLPTTPPYQEALQKTTNYSTTLNQTFNCPNYALSDGYIKM